MVDQLSGARIGLVLARSTTAANGIRDYAYLLLRWMRETGLNAELFEWADGAPWATRESPRHGVVPAELVDMDVLILQYNPFSFGRWGFAPGLPVFLARLRRRRPRPRIAVVFHETCVEMRSVSWALMGSWQYAQLLAVQAAADVQLCSIQRYAERLRKTALGRPVHHLPVASNLPDARTHREPSRRQLGAEADTVILSCIGLHRPERLEEYVLAAACKAGAVSPSVMLLNLGPGEQSTVQLASNVSMRSTGFLDEQDMAKHIAASDVFLAPYTDGVSTRRGTVMAALQHGVAVVGTLGRRTDDILREAPGLLLVELGRSDAFARSVSSLVRQPQRRAELGSAGRGLYEAQFDWPVLVRRLRAHLDV
jgi:glycosyltransferase involved in cell wall biosynthesis